VGIRSVLCSGGTGCKWADQEAGHSFANRCNDVSLNFLVTLGHSFRTCVKPMFD
jgi:hypothetical protein